MPELERQLQEEEKRLNMNQADKRLLREEVAEEEVSEIVSRWSGIPVARLVEGEARETSAPGRNPAPARDRPGGKP